MTAEGSKQSGILGARKVGEYATVKLCRVEEYYVDVYTPTQALAEERAGELVGPETPSDEWDVVHSEIVESRPVYEDNPDAHRVASWLDAPTAPSEDTFWDDSKHFDDHSGATGAGQ